jgi:hypothetical protein
MDSSDGGDDLTAEEAVKRAKAVAASMQAEQAAAAAAAASSGAGPSTSGIEAALKELDMDNYDADEGDNVMARLLAAGASNVYKGAHIACDLAHVTAAPPGRRPGGRRLTHTCQHAVAS